MRVYCVGVYTRQSILRTLNTTTERIAKLYRHQTYISSIYYF